MLIIDVIKLSFFASLMCENVIIVSVQLISLIISEMRVFLYLVSILLSVNCLSIYFAYFYVFLFSHWFIRSLLIYSVY